MRSLAVVVVAACGGGGAPLDAAIDASDGRATVASYPAERHGAVDLLFMIDNSVGTFDYEVSLASHFQVFLDTLQAIPLGLPDLHIGVVTSDLGTSAADGTTAPSHGGGAGSCGGQGEGGILRTTASVQGAFITATNHANSLADAFADLVRVGSTGCGFEQSIEATKRALTNTTDNAGFLRSDALLGIIYVTDEDDCSIAHPGILTLDAGTPYGPFSSFRCTRFGVTCDGGGATPDEMNTAGTKTGCHSNESGTDLTKIGDYVAFFKGLKVDPRDVMVASIAGPTTPFEVGNDPPPGQPSGTPYPQLRHSCTYPMEYADPAVRLQQLVQAMSGTTTSVCPTDLSGGLVDIAKEIRARVGDPCITAPVAQPLDCVISYDGGAVLPACDHTNDPCAEIDVDATACPEADHLMVNVFDSHAPPGAQITARCRPPG